MKYGYAILGWLSGISAVAFTMLSGPALGVWFIGLAIYALVRAEQCA